MKLTQHIAASLPLAAGVYLTTNSYSGAALAVAGSVLIDLDHLPDYLYFRGGWRGVKDFFDVHNNHRVPTALLFFHSWELVILLGLLAWFGLSPEWLKAVSLGMAYHLVLDRIFNRTPPHFYWIARRAWFSFDVKRLRRESPDRTADTETVRE